MLQVALPFFVCPSRLMYRGISATFRSHFQNCKHC